MCEHCAWEDWLAEIQEALVDVEDLPERAEEFAESVTEKLENIAEWIEENEHVTEAQQDAITNMRHGIGKWLR